MKLTAFVVVVAAAGAAGIILQTHHGIRMTNDAARFLSTAENLAAGKGLIDLSGGELWWWPPGYPISLSGLELAGIGARDGARFLNAALFGTTILVTGMWLRSVTRSASVVAIGTLTVAGSREFQLQAITMHSETLYVLLTIGSLVLVSEALRDDRNQSRRQRLLAAAGLLAGLSAATRYVGVVAIGSGLAVVLAWRPSRAALRARMRMAAVFGLVASLPVVIVLARNLVLEGSLLGNRLSHSAGLSVLDAIETIIRLHSPHKPTLAIPWIMLIAAGLAWLAGPPPASGLQVWASTAALRLQRLHCCISLPWWRCSHPMTARSTAGCTCRLRSPCSSWHARCLTQQPMDTWALL